MKKPEEIKKGLEACREDECHGQHQSCPYKDDALCMMHICSDALSYINQLEARVPKWISVKDRLPEDDVDVIVYAVSNNGGYTIVVTFHTHTLYGLNIEGWASPWQYFTRNYTITHWMPLPDPPKEGVVNQ